MAIKISEKDLARDLKRRFRKVKTDVNKSLRSASQRGRTLLTRRTPVDTGLMKNAWRATKKGAAAIINDAPHAGIIEEGARPHKVSRQGIEALTKWAQRKLGASPEEARAVAWGVAKKLAKEGQPGKFIARDSLDEIREFVRIAFERNLRKTASRALIKAKK